MYNVGVIGMKGNLVCLERSIGKWRGDMKEEEREIPRDLESIEGFQWVISTSVW